MQSTWEDVRWQTLYLAALPLMTQNKINSTSLTFGNSVVIKQLKRLTIFAVGPIGRAV